MFFRILKKDLKRKKTMNIILLLFVVLCSMFAAAAVNNIIAVTGGIEHYFDVAGVPDVVVNITEENDAEAKIRALTCVDEVKIENWLYVLSSKYFKHKGKKLDNFTNTAYLIPDSEMGINYFDENNNIIESVDKGCFYANAPFLQDLTIKVGDEVELDVGDSHLTLKYMGRLKGALFSSDSASNPMLIINSADYDYLDKDKAVHTTMKYNQLYVRTSDVSALMEIAKEYDGVYVSTRDEKKDI